MIQPATSPSFESTIMSRLRAGAVAPAQKPMMVALVLGLIVGVFSILGLTATSASAAVAAPKVGACYYYGPTVANAMSTSVKPVSCLAKKTAKTIAVGTLTSGTVYTETSLTGSTNRSRMLNTCLPAFRAKLGSTYAKRDMSAYDFVWFVPTKAEFAAGARWFRCDVILRGKTGLLTLPARAKYLEGVDLGNRYRACLNYNAQVMYSCSSTHSYRAISSFRMSGTSYPTSTAAQRAANANCARGWDMAIRPTKELWVRGDHQMTCYNKTTS